LPEPPTQQQQQQSASQNQEKQEKLSWDSKRSIVQFNNLGFLRNNPSTCLDPGSITDYEFYQQSPASGKRLPKSEYNENRR
jgi:hypothetical protein